MMNECYGKEFIMNGELLPSAEFNNSLLFEGDAVYEVLRMVRGNPVFFEDHMNRLVSSVGLQRKKILVDKETLCQDIIRLTRKNRLKEVNLKIVFNYNRGISNYLVYFIEPIYPTKEQYGRGVTGIFFFAERNNPESKVINHKLRSAIYHKLILEGSYEALLVNDDDLITEGSRTNIFFLRDNTLHTAPDNVVLNGITRKHILEICKENNISVKLSAVNIKDVKKYDAVFMTGTSPIVLPFCNIGDFSFNVGVPLIPELRNHYLKRAEESILQFKSGEFV